MSEDDCLGDHLDAMFGPDAPPLPWDESNEYRREQLDVYYQVGLVQAYSPKQLRRWLAEGTPAAGALSGEDEEAPADRGKAVDVGPRLVRVDEAAPLGHALAGKGHVIPGTLVLFVLSRGNHFCRRFMQTGLTE